MIARTLKDILTVKLKTRHDGYADQFNRIFMTKMLLMASIIMCVEYFSDTVNCMVPGNARHSKEFYQAACWISGFYVYDEMRGRIDKSGYFGMPQRVDFDGINKITNKLCLTKDFMHGNSDCVPMTKVYYLHYQWMHVYIAALGIFFYLPYIAFRIVNTDLINLKKQVKSSKTAVGKTKVIMKTYFNHSVNSVFSLRIRIWWNVLVKLLYVSSSLSAFFITDYFLQGKYISYGTDYIEWSEQNNTLKHTVLKDKYRANAGNILLPSMGYCDVHEASTDIRNTFHNKNRYICEISPHVLYQYVLAVLWFFFVASNLIALIGFFVYAVTNAYYLWYCIKTSPKQKIYQELTLREIEYLEYIKATDLAQYGDILRELKNSHIPEDYEMVVELESYIEGLYP